MWEFENKPLTLDQITQADRRRGYVPRYFAAKVTHIHEEVFEITRREYDFFYDVTSIVVGHLKWVIAGPQDNSEIWVYTGNPTHDDDPKSPRRGTEPISIPGVLTQNEGAVRFLSSKIPAVKNYFDRPNAYEEFWRLEAST